MLMNRISRLRNVLLIVLISILPMLTSCQSCRENNQEKEVIKSLDPGSFPEIIDVSFVSGNDLHELLIFFTDVYSEHLKTLIAAKSTGRFIDDIDSEIDYCQDVLDWLENLKLLD